MELDIPGPLFEGFLKIFYPGRAGVLDMPAMDGYGILRATILFEACRCLGTPGCSSSKM